MSDPVTNIEIEDVLSSIRRLVADGDKLRTAQPQPTAGPRAPLTLDKASLVPEPLPPSEPAAPRVPEAEPVKQAVQKFVLTASLRVDSEPEPQPKATPDPEAPAIVADVKAQDAPAADASTLLLWDDEAGEGLAEASEDVAGAEEGLVAAAPQAASQTDDPRADKPAAPAAYVAEGRSRLESTIAELEAAITGQPQDFEPDGSEETPQMDWSDGAAQPAFLSSRTLHRRAAVEDAQEVPAEPAPADAPQTPEAGPADVARDRLAETIAQQAADEIDGQMDETLTAYLEEDHVLDEETLRALVTEIVRQELQGALGERITRNVRKLVHREIFRVMSSQQFD